jgi:hypothetical protein
LGIISRESLHTWGLCPGSVPHAQRPGEAREITQENRDGKGTNL